jgi:ATP-dependent 26S proteasome regulatory subunit
MRSKEQPRLRPRSRITPGDAALHDVSLLVRTRYGLIHVDTSEEERAAGLIRHLADHLRLPFFDWSRSRGLQRQDADGPIYGTEDPHQALAHITSARFPALYHFKGLGAFLDDPLLTARLAEAAQSFEEVHGAVVLTGAGLELPQSLQALTAVVDLPEPTMEEYKQLIGHIVRDLSERMTIVSEINQKDLTQLLNNLKGLTLMEAEKVLTKAMVEDGKLCAKDIQAVIAHKKAIVEREGVLEYFPVDANMADIAGLAGLKEWLQQRKQIIVDPQRARDFGLSFPRGILLLGVPGCGKSLCAKAVANEWSLPLLKLDPANLYNKYMGESERNFKRAMRTSENLAPVVLWIDELEKAFSSSGDGQDGGTSKRIFGTFLSWLQERKQDVFVVATANDVSQLPPEFLRKGRFDEVFFVDLPSAEARRAIVDIHLRKRNQDRAAFDLDALTTATEGFSGAEIEQAIVAALFTAFAAGNNLTTALLLEEIAATRPIADTMHERIAALRAWAAGRVRNAN